MIRRMSRGIDAFMRRYIPDPLIYAFFLTFIVFFSASLLPGRTFGEVAGIWGNGFWSLSTFTLQMVMILFLGYLVALSAPVKSVLKKISYVPKSIAAAAFLTSLIALISCSINWGLGLIVSAMFCKEMGERFKGKNFRLFVAISYSGFIVWHGGLSGSIPLVISTPNNFSESLIGGILPITTTIFALPNTIIMALHFILFPVLSYLLMKTSCDEVSIIKDIKEEERRKRTDETPADRLENSRIITWGIVFLGMSYLLSTHLMGGLILDLNVVNFIFFLLAIALHKTPRNLLSNSEEAAKKIWPLLLQYPLYAGIMTLMKDGGLGEILSDWFIGIANKDTLPVMIFLSAGLINIFIPSGGGQWAVQGPMVIEASKHLDADIIRSIMAVAWGDSWTNMIQPFWALPLLAIAGLRSGDMMGYLLIFFFLSGMICMGCFWFC